MIPSADSLVYCVLWRCNFERQILPVPCHGHQSFLYVSLELESGLRRSHAQAWRGGPARIFSERLCCSISSRCWGQSGACLVNCRVALAPHERTRGAFGELAVSLLKSARREVAQEVAWQETGSKAQSHQHLVRNLFAAHRRISGFLACDEDIRASCAVGAVWIDGTYAVGDLAACGSKLNMSESTRIYSDNRPLDPGRAYHPGAACAADTTRSATRMRTTRSLPTSITTKARLWRKRYGEDSIDGAVGASGDAGPCFGQPMTRLGGLGVTLPLLPAFWGTRTRRRLKSSSSLVDPR